MKKVLALFAIAGFVACGSGDAPKKAEAPAAPAAPAVDTTKKDTSKVAAPAAAPAPAAAAPKAAPKAGH